jgi:hypothetical protein
MAFYTSHIYIEANERLLASLKDAPIFLEGLFRLHGVYPPDIDTKYKTMFPANGLTVIREICDLFQGDDEHEEARIHQSHNEPILSWWKIKGSIPLEVIMPSAIPTLAFGKIYNNHKHNPYPPKDFLQFLKQLSLTEKVAVVFYHHYSAYEDELANSEYAWIFGEEEMVLVRHISEPYETVQYITGAEPKIIYSGRVEYGQPILEFVMNKFGVSLHRFDDRRPYFYNFPWKDYQV